MSVMSSSLSSLGRRAHDEQYKPRVDGLYLRAMSSMTRSYSMAARFFALLLAFFLIAPLSAQGQTSEMLLLTTAESSSYTNGNWSDLQAEAAARGMTAVDGRGALSNPTTPLPITANTKMIVVITIIVSANADRMAELVTAMKTRPDLLIVGFLDSCPANCKLSDNLQPFLDGLNDIRPADWMPIELAPAITAKFPGPLNTHSPYAVPFAPSLPMMAGQNYSPLLNVPSDFVLYYQGTSPDNAAADPSNVVGMLLPKALSNDGQGACVFVTADFNPLYYNDGYVPTTQPAAAIKAFANAAFDPAGACAIKLVPIRGSIAVASGTPTSVAASTSLPQLTLTCTPTAESVSTNRWRVELTGVTTSADCTLGTTGGVPAPGYSFSGTVYDSPSGTIDSATGDFTVPLTTPANYNVSATVSLTMNPSVTINASIDWAASVAVTTGGALPDLTLTCSPAATPVSATRWSVASGASCTLGTTGGTPPSGYSFAAVTYGPSGSINASSGAFTAPSGGANLTAAVSTSNNAAVNVTATMAWDASVTLTTGGTLPDLTLTCSPMATQVSPGSWTVAGGADCTLGASGGTPPLGQSFNVVTYGPTGSINALSGDFKVPMAGITLTATMKTTNNPSTQVDAGIAFDPATPPAAMEGGTLPSLTLTCTPMATEDLPGQWTVAQGAGCTLGVTGGVPPPGYSFDEVTYEVVSGSTSVNEFSGDFTVPTGGASLEATVTVKLNPAVAVRASIDFDASVDAGVAATGSVPHLTLTCTPMATQDSPNNWTVATGANCTLGTTGGFPPPGYSFDTVTYGPLGSIGALSGDFTVPTGGISTLAAKVTVSNNAATQVSGTVAFASSVPAAIAATGTLPRLTLDCTPMATRDATNHWTVAEGATCTLGTAGGLPPPGHSFDVVTYGPDGEINTVSGDFTVPVGGLSSLTATVTVSDNPAAPVSGTVAWDASISAATAATGSLPNLTLTCTPMATLDARHHWTAAEGATCTLGTTGGFPPPGYSFDAVTYGPSGAIDPISGDFTVPAGGISTLTATVSITHNDSTQVSGTVAWDSSVDPNVAATGALPHLTLMCIPMATQDSTNHWTVAEGAHCEFGTAGGMPPYGYSFETVTYGPASAVNSANGDFAVPVGGGQYTATVTVTHNPAATVNGEVVWDSSIPTWITETGTLPHLTLSCTPMATQDATNSWTVAEGASCELGAAGGFPPYGYSFDAVVYGPGGEINAINGDFTVPTGGAHLTATVSIIDNPVTTITATTVFDPSVLAALATQGTPPYLYLECTPMAMQSSAYSWSVAEGANCTFHPTGGFPPPGHSFDEVTYSASAGEINTVSGNFTVPVGGADYTADFTLMDNPAVHVSGTVAWNSAVPVAVAATGALPHLTLDCTPMATPDTFNSWTVAAGATCTLGTAGGFPPPGHSFSVVAYSSATGYINAVSGDFTVPASGISSLVATVSVSNNPSTIITASGVFDSSVPTARAAQGSAPYLYLECTPMAMQYSAYSWSVAEGATCEFHPTGGLPPPGYSFDEVTYTASAGAINAFNGDFTVPTGGAAYTASFTLKDNPAVHVNGEVVWDSSISAATAATGTLPHLTLNCSPMATQDSHDSWTVAEGASCTFGTAGGFPPYGYSFDVVTYGPSGKVNTLSGDFVVPVGGAHFTATVSIVNNPAATLSATTAFDASVPPALVAQGSPPYLYLECTPMAMQSSAYSWSVAEGANCAFHPTGGMPPAGYSFDEVTFAASAGSINETSGEFTVPVGGAAYTATFTLKQNPAVTVSGTTAFDPSVTASVAATGTLPHLTLTCSPLATQEANNTWLVAQGAKCTLGTSGGFPPPGYSYGTVTYSPTTSINATSGDFTVPTGGITTLVATVTLTGNAATQVHANIAYDASVSSALAATGALPHLTLTCTPLATQDTPNNWTVAEGAACSLGTSGGTPPPGYSFDVVTYGPLGAINTLSGDFTVPTGGVNTLTATVTLTNNPSTQVSASIAFDPSIPAATAASGSLPNLTLTCTPMAAQDLANHEHWTVAEGAHCTLGTTGGLPPPGHSFDAVIYGPTGEINTDSGDFTVPPGGITNLTATVTITSNAAAMVTGTIAFDPGAAATNGTLPHLTLDCTPIEEQDAPNVWTVAGGAHCTLGTTGGFPPPGYSFGTVTFGATTPPAVTIDSATGEFIVPSAGANLTASVTVTANAAVTASGTVTINGGGTPPYLTLTCTPVATQNAANNWTVAAGAQCTLGTTGGLPPPGYSFSSVTYGPSGTVDPSGTFTVPSSGIGNLSATVGLTLTTTVTVSGHAAFDPGTDPAVVARSTPPALTLTCSPAGTAAGANAWTVNEAARCQLGITGTPPSGYSFDVVTYGPTPLVDPATGMFFVPTGGVNNLSAIVTLKGSGSGGNSGAAAIPTLEPKALMLLALFVLLFGGIALGGVEYKEQHERRKHR